MKGITPELAAQIEAERKERAAQISRVWRDGLTHKDWLLDGSPIRGAHMLETFSGLQWEKAWIDLGPSVAGNLGPYWHVPDAEDDCVHRLYPKVLTTKWALLILHACNEATSRPSR